MSSIITTTTGPGSTSGGKLPETVRAALEGGEYDAGALRLVVHALDAAELSSYELTGDRLKELGETVLQLFGMHPNDAAELEDPVFPIAVLDEDFNFTPGHPDSLWPDGDYTGWKIRVRVQEYITDTTGGDIIFEQRFALVEVEPVQESETPITGLLGRHPIGGWLARTWETTDELTLDWNGAGH